MKGFTMRLLKTLFVAFIVLVFTVPVEAGTRVITDATGRMVEVPAVVNRVICSVSGCLRLLTYLQSQSLAVAVDDIEVRRQKLDRKSTRLNSSHIQKTRIPSSA